MSKVDLDALEALEARASPGNWKLSHLEMFAHHTDAYLFQNTKHQESSKVSLEDKELIEAMRNNIKHMIEELRAAREVIKTVEWAGSSPQSHGEDCDYWDFEAEAPSGEKCECGFAELREALNKYFEAVK